MIFCLGLLRLTERSARRLADNLRLYKHAMVNEEVAAAMQAIITKVRGRCVCA